MSDAEHSGDEGPSEAELALKKRRQAPISTKGLDEAARELLDTNKKDRDRMEEEIQELKRRTEKRKKERIVEEKRMAAERAAEDEKRKTQEEAKRKQKDEEDLKRKHERAQKKAEFDTKQEVEEGVPKKSKEQLDAEKKAILKQRIVPLNAGSLDSSGLSDKAKELHKLIQRLEGEKYDLERRFKLQQYDMTELADRARQANKVGRGDGLKRVQAGDGDDTVQERYAGTPSRILMYSKYERQKDLRGYKDRQTVHSGPQFISPPQRIKPTRIVKWGEQGLPQYEELPEGAAHAEE